MSKDKDKENKQKVSKVGKQEISKIDKENNNGFYSCLCGFKTKSLAEFRRHLTISHMEPGKHKSLGTKPSHPVGVTVKGSKKISKGGKGKKGEPHAVKEGLIVDMLPEPQGIEPIEPLLELEPGSDEDLEEETLEENAKEIRTEPPPRPPKRRLEPAFGEAEKETFTGDLVTGDTLPFKVEVSIKTLALYQMAATEVANYGDGELSLGRFLDTCVEDYYIGRGYDLGLLELKGGEHA